MKLDHINIRAPLELLDREKRFFCDLLGLREGTRPSFGSRGYWLYSGDEAIVHLAEDERQPAGDLQVCLDHVAFRSEGLLELLGTLDHLGTDYMTAYVPELDLTQVFVRSPSNTRIEVNFVGEKM